MAEEIYEKQVTVKRRIKIGRGKGEINNERRRQSTKRMDIT
jgi:hypothetical protein